MTSVDQEIHSINMTSGREHTDGRTDGRIDGWTRFTYLQSEEIDLYEEMSHNAYETHRAMIIGLKAEN